MLKKEVKFRKKGQITLFIILGILMLTAVGMFIYFRSSVSKEAEIITTEYSPVIGFVDSCIDSIARDGIKTLGLNGGYIYFPPNIESNPRAYLGATPIPELKNPYWWYDGIEAVPTEAFLKNQLERHVTTQLKTCLNKFDELPDYKINEAGSIKTKVELTRTGVNVKVEYPLLVKKAEQIMRIEEFTIDVPVRLKKVYELARAIMEIENNNMFLEEKTIDLISMDDDIPVTEVKLTCEKQQWLLSDIKEKVKRLLRVNLPYVKIKGTDYNQGAYVPTPTGAHTYNDSYYNYHYIWDIDQEDLTGMHVSISYDDKWPLTINARPSRNGILSSNAEKGQEMLSFFCMHIAHFTYDIVYPAMVSIADEKARDHERFLFRFPFKVSVNHNQPYRESFGYELLEGTDRIDSEEYCREIRNEISIYTMDKATEEPVGDVDLTFVCGRFSCDIGKAEWIGYGAAAGLTKRLPYCTQAIIIANKEGYDETKTFIQTDIEGRSYDLSLAPVKEIDDYLVEKHMMSSPQLADYFREGDKAVITLKIPEKNFESYGVYPAAQKVPLKFLAKEDNTYKLEIYVTNGEKFIGGYVGDWTITKNQIDTASRIKFHTIISDAQTDEETYLFLSGLESYSEQIPGPEIR